MGGLTLRSTRGEFYPMRTIADVEFIIDMSMLIKNEKSLHSFGGTCAGRLEFPDCASLIQATLAGHPIVSRLGAG